MNKKIAIIPGSFDPVTKGHLDLYKKASEMFDEIHIIISNNPNKKYFFNSEERYLMVKDEVIDIKNIKVLCINNELIANYAKKNDIKYLIRSIRTSYDIETEKLLAFNNYFINNDIVTLLIISSPELSHISSSLCWEILQNNGKISHLVSEKVENLMKNKISLVMNKKTNDFSDKGKKWNQEK